MKGLPNTPWVSRFIPLLDKSEIKRRALRSATPLTGLDELPVATASSLLANELKHVFYPTTQAVDVLYQFVEMVLAHSLQHYPDEQTYLDWVYKKETPLPDFIPPLCLTGLAGIGKSGVARAFARILPVDDVISCSADEVKHPLKSLWKIDIRAQSKLSDLLAPLGGTEGSLRDQTSSARRRAYRMGISLVVPDEFQFMTASSTANTRIVQALMSLAYLGLPFVFIANFSLLHRLLKRPQEDRDRLLSKIVVMMPDAPESEDWLNTLKLQLAVAPGVFQIDPDIDGEQIYRYCAGIKRYEARLLEVAYALAREGRPHDRMTVVTMTHVKAAYESCGYVAQRADAELITQQFILNRQADKKRSDLWCPIEQLCKLSDVLSTQLQRQRSVNLAAKIQYASASQAERQVYGTRVSPSDKSCTNNVVGLNRKKRPSVETLKANASMLRGPDK
jgi:hypothetical protein